MKKRMLYSIIVLVAMLAMPLSVGATGSLPGSGWWSSATVQNVGSADGTVQMTVYDTGSTATFSSTDFAVPDGEAVTIMPSAFSGLSAGFQGSGVVSSNQPAVAVGLVANFPFSGLGTTGGKAAARYQGMNTPATTLYSPVAKNKWFDATTLFYIQNAGTTATTATVVFSMGSGSVYTFTTPSIGPGQMTVVQPSDAGVPNGPSNNATMLNLGSMVVTSNTANPLAGSYVEHRTDQAVATTISSMRLLAVTDFSDKAFAPAVKSFWANRFTGLAILNTSASPINATISYVGTSGPCTGQTFQDVINNIQPNRRGTVLNFGPGYSNLPTNCLAAATVQANGSFVATVNENHTPGNPVSGNVSYMFPFASATTKVAAPSFFDKRDGFTSGFQVQNVGSVATNITATFYCKGQGNSNTPFTAVTQPISINPGATFLFYQPSTYGPVTAKFTVDNWDHNNAVCSAIVTSDSQPIVGLMNNTSDTAGAVDDSKYEAFSITP